MRPVTRDTAGRETKKPRFFHVEKKRGEQSLNIVAKVKWRTIPQR